MSVLLFELNLGMISTTINTGCFSKRCYFASTEKTSLLSTTSKLVTIIVAEKVSCSDISKQQRFRKNRFTMDAIFILRQISEKAIEYKETAFICFIRYDASIL